MLEMLSKNKRKSIIFMKISGFLKSPPYHVLTNGNKYAKTIYLQTILY